MQMTKYISESHVYRGKAQRLLRIAFGIGIESQRERERERERERTNEEEEEEEKGRLASNIIRTNEFPGLRLLLHPPPHQKLHALY